MKRLLIPVAIALVAICASLSCLSAKARDSALLPAVRTAWPAVRADVQLGIDEAKLDDTVAVQQAVDGLQVALDQGNVVQLGLAPWPVLEVYGERGIAARVSHGQVSSLVAPSLLERLHNFGLALAKFQVTQ